MESKKYKVAVLMATYNGIEWLPEQVNSILIQSDVEVRLLVSDDDSDDGCRSWLEKLVASDDRVQLLPKKVGTGSAGKNFYRLICDADIEDVDFIAFADQDDIWFKHKLTSQIEQVQQYSADGVSSNVVAFWPNGLRHLINKSAPQKNFDFLYESAGPGCSFLIKPALFLQIKALLENTSDTTTLPELHDWLIYAVCRAIGNKWHIAERPLLEYRQHASNVVGAHHGVRAKLKRVKSIQRGWYRNEVQKIAHIVMELTTDKELHHVCEQLIRLNIVDRFRLLSTVSNARRHRSEQLALAMLLASFTF